MLLILLIYRKNVWIKYLELVCTLMSYYREILIIFVDFSLINQFYNYFILLVYGDRVDGYMIRLVRQCLFIQILIIKEVFFSVVIFLMVYYNRNLIDLFVRCDMVLYVNDLLNDIELLLCGFRILFWIFYQLQII